MSTVTFQPYSPGDEIGIVELLKLVYPKWENDKNPIGNWKWRYLESPNKSLIFIAKDGEKVVGAAHSIELEIKIGDSIQRCTYGDSMTVHPEYRKSGIWGKLKALHEEKRAKMGINFHYMATENPIVKENAEKMGFIQSSHYLTHNILVRDQDAFLKNRHRDNLVTRMGVAALSGLGEVKKIFSNHNRSEDYSIIDTPKFDERIDGFWNKIKESYDYITMKNADYLNWKHNRPNFSQNKIRFAVKDNVLLGYSTLGIQEDGEYREGLINDLLAVPDKPDVADALIEDAIEYFKHEKVAVIYFQTTKGHPYGTIAERRGFIDASSQNKTYFYFDKTNSKLVDYINSLDPSKVQLKYF